MLDIQYEKSFKKDFKLMQKKGLNMSLLEKVIEILASEQPLPPQYRDHTLYGNYKGYRECHIEPDWLLIYKIYNDVLLLALSRTGSHSDLFK